MHTSASQPREIPPGWYADPLDPTKTARYWDGSSWTTHRIARLDAAPGPPALPRKTPAVHEWDANRRRQNREFGVFVACVLLAPVVTVISFLAAGWQWSLMVLTGTLLCGAASAVLLVKGNQATEKRVAARSREQQLREQREIDEYREVVEARRAWAKDHGEPRR